MEEKFVIEQIANTGVIISAEEQRSGIQKYIPSFLA
jgi:hypothetical protein